MRHLDLFSGIGGFALAARNVGWETVGFCEIDPYCQKVLAKHWPGVPIYDDITEYTGTAGHADVITGGFPCQDISHAGKGAGIDGERSGLWSELARIIGEVRPRYAVLENVAALLSGDRGRWFQRVLGDLASLGYDCEWHCIPASAVGAPHQRDRIWIVCYPGGEQHQSTGNALGRQSSEKLCHTEGSVADANQPRLEGRLREVLSERARERASGQSGDSWDGYWVTEPEVGRVADGISTELDCTRQIRKWCKQSSDKKTRTARNELVQRFLRAMWENRDIAETSPDIYIRRICDSVPEVPLQDTQSRWLLGPWIEKDQGLHDMWEAFYSEPQQKAQDLQFKLLERARTKKRPRTLEGSRTDRLRGLGNAIVPQVAQLIFEAIEQ